MKHNKYLFSTLLTLLLFLALAAATVLRLMQPAVILPPLNIPNVAGLCLLALLAEYYLAGTHPRCYGAIALLAALTFGLLPLFAGFACQHSFWKLGLAGGAAATVTSWLFTGMTDRLLSGPQAKAAPVLSALGLFLAAQAFAGILL